MEERSEFRIGSTIWPSISTLGGNAGEETKERIHSTISEFAEFVAKALQLRGLERFAFPLFRPFNALFALTGDALLCVGTPLTGGVATLRFLDVRDSLPSMTAGQLAVDAQRQLGWTTTFSFQIPASVMSATSEDRERQLGMIAEDIAERLRADIERQSHQVRFHPVFRTQLEDLESDDSLCFVLMPFSAQFDRLYREVIAPAVEESGLKPLRADEVFSPTPVVEDVWANIAAARVLIADVTNKNPNVFYELGLAHAVGRPVIVITQNKADVPFDIAYIRYFVYADNQVGWQELKRQLGRAITSIVQGGQEQLSDGNSNG